MFINRIQTNANPEFLYYSKIFHYTEIRVNNQLLSTNPNLLTRLRNKGASEKVIMYTLLKIFLMRNFLINDETLVDIIGMRGSLKSPAI